MHYKSFLKWFVFFSKFQFYTDTYQNCDGHKMTRAIDSSVYYQCPYISEKAVLKLGGKQVYDIVQAERLNTGRLI